MDTNEADTPTTVTQAIAMLKRQLPELNRWMAIWLITGLVFFGVGVAFLFKIHTQGVYAFMMAVVASVLTAASARNMNRTRRILDKNAYERRWLEGRLKYSYRASIRTRETLEKIAEKEGLSSGSELRLLLKLFETFAGSEFTHGNLTHLIEDMSAGRLFDAELYWRAFADLIARDFYEGSGGVFWLDRSVWDVYEEEHPRPEEFDIPLVE